MERIEVRGQQAHNDYVRVVSVPVKCLSEPSLLNESQLLIELSSRIVVLVNAKLGPVQVQFFECMTQQQR